MERDRWRCTRHMPGAVVLSNNVNGVGHFAVTFMKRSDKRWAWWEAPNVPHLRLESGGFIFGPGFRAFAQDFPDGTSLTITADIRQPAGKEKRG